MIDSGRCPSCGNCTFKDDKNVVRCDRCGWRERDFKSAPPASPPIITDADREASPQFHAAMKAAHEVKAARDAQEHPSPIRAPRDLSLGPCDPTCPRWGFSPAPPAWTRETPTVPGAWWFCGTHRAVKGPPWMKVYNFTEKDGVVVVPSTNAPVSELLNVWDGFWLGPLAVPPGPEDPNSG